MAAVTSHENQVYGNLVPRVLSLLSRSTERTVATRLRIRQNFQYFCRSKQSLEGNIDIDACPVNIRSVHGDFLFVLLKYSALFHGQNHSRRLTSLVERIWTDYNTIHICNKFEYMKLIYSDLHAVSFPCSCCKKLRLTGIFLCLCTSCTSSDNLINSRAQALIVL